MAYADAFKKLPLSLRNRFNSIGAYARSLIELEQTENPRRKLIDPSDMQTIQVLVFAWSIWNLLIEGAAAAERAVATCETLGVPGFRVGSADFRRGSEDLVLGKKLALELEESLSEELKMRFHRVKNARELTLALYAEVRSVRHLD